MGVDLDEWFYKWSCFLKNLGKSNYSHYFRDVRHLKYIDIYRVIDLFNINNPCIQHTVKKLMCAGSRGSKNYIKDVTEARDSLNRLLKMHEEDLAKGKF